MQDFLEFSPGKVVENCLKIEGPGPATASHDAGPPDAGAAFSQLRRRL